MNNSTKLLDLQALFDHEAMPKWGEEAIGLMHALELTYLLQTDLDTFEVSKKKRLSDTCIQIEGSFPEAFDLMVLPATLWVFERTEDEVTRRHVAARFHFDATLGELFSMFAYLAELPAQLILGASPEHGSPSFSPKWDEVVPDVFFTSAPPQHLDEAIQEHLPDFPLEQGLNTELKAASMLNGLIPGLDLNTETIPALRLNVRSGMGYPQFALHLDLASLFSAEARSRGENALHFQLDTLTVRFTAQERIQIQAISLVGDIRTPLHTKDGEPETMSFEGTLNLSEPSLDVRLLHLPALGSVIRGFVPEDDPTLASLSASGLDSLRIEELSFRLMLSPLEIRRAAITLQTDESLKLLDMGDGLGHLITLDPRMQLEVIKPLSEDRRVVLELEGFAQIGQTQLHAYYHSQRNFFQVELAMGTAAHSESILERFPILGEALGAHDAEGNNQGIRILDMRLVASKAEQWAFDLDISLESDWKIPIGETEFWLRGLHVSLQYRAGKLAELEMVGQLAFGELGLELAAIYDAEAGWILRGRSTPFDLVLSSPAGSDEPSLLSTINLPQLNTLGSSSAEALTDPFGLTLHLNRIDFEAILPPKASEETNELSLVINVTTEVGEELTFPLDSFFLHLRWQKKLLWEALLHFTFLPEREVNGETREATSLVLSSTRTEDELSFQGTLENLYISELVQFFADRFDLEYAPPPILEGLLLNTLDISLTKKDDAWDFALHCNTRIPLEAAEAEEEEQDHGLTVDLTFTVKQKVAEDKKTYEVALVAEAKLDLGSEGTLTFALDFSAEAGKALLMGTYVGTRTIPVTALLAQWLGTGPSETELKIDIHAVYLLLSRTVKEEKAKYRMLFGTVMGADLALGELPFLASVLPPDQSAGVEQVHLGYASGDWDRKLLKKLNKKLGDHALPLPEEESEGLKKGFVLAGTLHFGEDFTFPFSLGQSQETEKPTQAATEPSKKQEAAADTTDTQAKTKAPATTKEKKEEEQELAGLVKWIRVNKSLGPFTLGRIGLQFDYEQFKLFIMLDAGLKLAVLEASVDGLRIGSSLSNFEAEVHLKGLGIDFKKEPLEIGGALLFSKDPEHKDAINLAGMVTLRYQDLGISLLGSYTDKLGKPSVLMYGMLNYPIGGPPYFFVEGLAAGVGIHRKVHYPEIEKLGDFALIKSVMHPDPKATLTDQVAALDKQITPELGSYFFAAGIRFSTFKLLDSFILLILGLGEQVEVDLLGYSMLTLPKAEPGESIDPIAQARLMVRAAFRPQEGTLKVEARLDPENSFLLSRKCKLQGGFAFYAWFDAENLSEEEGKPGEFVLTLGGYHPRYQPKPYYPQVPRVGFHWQVDPYMVLKGELYFALTPNAVMAGGMLEANWHKDHCEANFRLALNLLMQWEPFHYEGDFSLTIQAAYRDGAFQIELEISTEVEIWGPEFGGTAHLKILFIEIDVDFGAPREASPKVMSWPEFAGAFLTAVPTAATPVPGVLSARVARGLLPGAKDQQGPIRVSPSALELAVESRIPFTSGSLNAQDIDPADQQAEALGIAPMNQQGLTSHVTLTVLREGEPAQGLVAVPILQNVPAALWGSTFQPELNDPTTVPGCLMGYRLVLDEQHANPLSSYTERPATELDAILFDGEIPAGPDQAWEYAPLPDDLASLDQADAETDAFLAAFGLNQAPQRVPESLPLTLLKAYEVSPA